MEKVIKSDYQNNYVLWSLFLECVGLLFKGIWFILKWMAIGFAGVTVLTTKPKHYDILTKVVVGASGLHLLRRTLRPRRRKKSIFRF